MKLVSLFSGMSFFTPVLSLYFLSRGVSLGTIIFAQAAYSVLIILAEVPTGVVADKFGHKTSVVLGMSCNVLAYLCFLISPGVLAIFVAYVFFGLGDALVSGSQEALVHTSSEGSSFRKNWSKIMSFENYGSVVGTLVASVLYSVLDERSYMPLLFCGMAARIVSVGVAALAREVHDASSSAGTNMLSIARSAMTQIAKSSTLRNLTFVKLLTLSAQYVVYSVYAPYFKQAGVLPIMIGLVLTIGALSNGITLQFSHKLEKYLSLNRAVIVLPMLMGGTFIAMSIITNPWLLVVSFVFLQAQFNLLDPIISDYVNHEAEPSSRATVISGISLIRSIGNTLSKVVLGVAVAGIGVAGMFRVQALYLFVGGLLSWWLLKRCGCAYVLPTESKV